MTVALQYGVRVISVVMADTEHLEIEGFCRESRCNTFHESSGTSFPWSVSSLDKAPAVFQQHSNCISRKHGTRWRMGTRGLWSETSVQASLPLLLSRLQPSNGMLTLLVSMYYWIAGGEKVYLSELVGWYGGLS